MKALQTIAALFTALAQLLEIDRHELVAAIGAVQCRAMARQVDAELAGLMEGER